MRYRAERIERQWVIRDTMTGGWLTYIPSGKADARRKAKEMSRWAKRLESAKRP